MRKLIRLVVLLVILVLVAGATFWFYVDRIAKEGVERGATYALGVPTTVGDADVGLLVGAVGLDDLTVSNPQGYETPHLLAVQRFDLGVVTNTLFKETIQVNRFELDGVDLHVEQKIGTSNMAEVLENIKARTGGGGEPPEEKEEPAGKKVQVDRIVVRNITAHVQTLPVGGKVSTVDVEVPEIVLEDVTSDEGKGLAVAELTRRLLPAILTAVINKSRGLPNVDLDGLAANVGETTRALGKGAQDLVQQVGAGAGGLLDSVFKGAAGKEGDEKEGDGLLEGLLKPKDEGEKQEGGLLNSLFKKDEKE